MEVIRGKLCGFCAGVSYTINKALEEVENSNDTIYCLGEIIHNEIVIKDLEDKGMITVNDIDEVPEDSKAIFRAHGEPKEIYDKAQSKNIEVIDLTCGKIRIIRKKIEDKKDKSFIIIIGKKSHPEITGNISYAGDNSYIIEDKEDILKAYQKYQESKMDTVYIISQTTFSSTKFDNLVKEIKDVFKKNDIDVDKTICDATENRQKETLELSKIVDKMIIIGGKHSSNTKELATIAEANAKETLLIQSVEDLKNILFDSKDKIGIMAGASTPKKIIDEVEEYLRNE